MNFKDDLTEYKYLYCKKRYQHRFDEKSKERFFNTYKFSNNKNNKFILLLRNGIYPYEYMDDLEKSNKYLLPEKEDFNSHLTWKIFLMQIKRTQKDFEIKNLGEYHGLYV